MVPELSMVPSLVIVVMKMVSVTPEFIVQVSPGPIVSPKKIVVLTVNVLEAASAS